MADQIEDDESGGDGTHAGPAAGNVGKASRPAALSPKGTLIQSLPAMAARGEALAPKRGKGRPKGARNRRTSEITEQLLATYGDPLEADMAIGTMELGEMITTLRALASDRGLKLGMTIGDIAKWQQSCRAAVAPYLHAKRAPETATGETVVPIIQFGTFQGGPTEGRGRSIEEVQQNQQVIEVDVTKSHD